MEWMQRDLSKLDEKDTLLMGLEDYLEATINDLNGMRKDHDEVVQHDIDYAVEALTETMRNVQASREIVKGEMNAIEKQLESEEWGQ